MATVALSVLMVMKNDAAAEVKQLMPEAMERTGGGKQPKVTVLWNGREEEDEKKIMH